MMIDDAHSSGVLGRNGRGTVDHFGLHGRVDVQVGTLSKAIGVLGGYVCGSRDLIEFLYHRARPFLFSTSHPPAVAAACLAAFDILENEPERIDKLWENTRYFKAALAERRIRHRRQRNAHHADHGGRGQERPTRFRRRCSKTDCSPPGSVSPRCPKARRAFAPLSPPRTPREMLDRAVEILTRVAKKMGILQ